MQCSPFKQCSPVFSGEVAPQFFTADTVHRIGREPRCGFAAWIAPSQVVHRGVLLLLAASGALACREWWYRRVRRFLVIKSCHQDDVPEYFDVLYFGCSSHQNGHQIVRPKIAQNECSSHPGGFQECLHALPRCSTKVMHPKAFLYMLYSQVLKSLRFHVFGFTPLR